MQVAKIKNGKQNGYIRIEMQISTTLYSSERLDFFSCLRDFLDLISIFGYSKSNLLFEFETEG